MHQYRAQSGTLFLLSQALLSASGVGSAIADANNEDEEYASPFHTYAVYIKSGTMIIFDPSYVKPASATARTPRIQGLLYGLMKISLGYIDTDSSCIVLDFEGETFRIGLINLHHPSPPLPLNLLRHMLKELQKRKKQVHTIWITGLGDTDKAMSRGTIWWAALGRD